MDGQNYLVFHTAADDSYMNSSANFKGADVTSNTAITLYFHGANGAESQDSVVLNFTAGKEVQVMEALGSALAGAKNPVTVVADDINSKYVDDNITSCGAISVNRGRYATVKSITGDTTLTTADSGKIITINPGATSLIQLPAAADNAGWNCRITCTEGDGGTMDQIVNIGTLAGEFFDGFIVTADGGGASIPNGTSNDFLTVLAAANSGLTFDIYSDGTRMVVSGGAVDATDCAFADTAAS